MMRVPVVRAAHAADLPLPAYATEGAAGMDLCAAIGPALTLAPGRRAVVPTGIRVAVPAGYEAQVRPRSGLAARLGLGLVNAPGTIDSDYTGEIAVILINWGEAPLTIRRGDRIAQLVFAPVVRVEWAEWAERADGGDGLPVTARGAGGFGHTGGHAGLRRAGPGAAGGADRDADA